jgi:hypothetical protein
MNTLHSPAKKKESRDGNRNSLVTKMLQQEHSFCLSFYYSLSKKTSILRGLLPKNGNY